MELDLAYISELLQALSLAILPVLAGAAVAALVAKYGELRGNLNEKQQFLLDSFISVAVYAAEQMGAGGFIEDKLDYATSVVQAYLDRTGLKLDAIEIRARIEAAVKAQFPNPT